MPLGGSEKEGKQAKRVRERGFADEVYRKRAAHDQEGEASGIGAEGRLGENDRRGGV